tara:strand:- start:3532 stop:4470 length:939 start_codon:yes stop_codon:yes gene_type:complete
MLSFSRGKPIAKIVEGKHKGRIIHIYGENEFDTDTKPDISIPENERSELLTKTFYKENKIPSSQKTLFNEIIDGKQKDRKLSGEMKEKVDAGNKFVDTMLKTRILFDDKETRLFPLPQKESERLYVPAPSGSGKSTFIGMYLEELRKKYKKRPIYIFSRVQNDKPLDKFKNTTRIPLEQDYFNRNPLEIEAFKDGILIFDDIDTILDKSLVKYIRGFRDDVLETGRHYNITALSTSHLIANFLATRTLINEAMAIVIFPKGSSFYAISNFLERYMGFNKEKIRYVEDLPTRWVWLWKEYPKYAISEKGAFIF